MFERKCQAGWESQSLARPETTALVCWQDPLCDESTTLDLECHWGQSLLSPHLEQNQLPKVYQNVTLT
jgi:hypothetical protein